MMLLGLRWAKIKPIDRVYAGWCSTVEPSSNITWMIGLFPRMPNWIWVNFDMPRWHIFPHPRGDSCQTCYPIGSAHLVGIFEISSTPSIPIKSESIVYAQLFFRRANKLYRVGELFAVGNFCESLCGCSIGLGTDMVSCDRVFLRLCLHGTNCILGGSYFIAFPLMILRGAFPLGHRGHHCGWLPRLLCHYHCQEQDPNRAVATSSIQKKWHC